MFVGDFRIVREKKEGSSWEIVRDCFTGQMGKYYLMRSNRLCFPKDFEILPQYFSNVEEAYKKIKEL